MSGHQKVKMALLPVKMSISCYLFIDWVMGSRQGGDIMVDKLNPEIGGWYRGEDGQFKVVAWDERSGSVEVQYFDGTLTGVDIELWDGLVLSCCPAPEDWSGPFDDVERAELDDAEAAVFLESRNDPLNELEFYLPG